MYVARGAQNQQYQSLNYTETSEDGPNFMTPPPILCLLHQRSYDPAKSYRTYVLHDSSWLRCFMIFKLRLLKLHLSIWLASSHPATISAHTFAVILLFNHTLRFHRLEITQQIKCPALHERFEIGYHHLLISCHFALFGIQRIVNKHIAR